MPKALSRMAIAKNIMLSFAMKLKSEFDPLNLAKGYSAAISSIRPLPEPKSTNTYSEGFRNGSRASACLATEGRIGK